MSSNREQHNTVHISPRQKIPKQRYSTRCRGSNIEPQRQRLLSGHLGLHAPSSALPRGVERRNQQENYQPYDVLFQSELRLWAGGPPFVPGIPKQLRVPHPLLLAKGGRHDIHPLPSSALSVLTYPHNRFVTCNSHFSTHCRTAKGWGTLS